MRSTEQIATWQFLDRIDDPKTAVAALLDQSLTTEATRPADDLEPRHAYRTPSAWERQQAAAELERGIGHSALTLQYEGELPEYCR